MPLDKLSQITKSGGQIMNKRDETLRMLEQMREQLQRDLERWPPATVAARAGIPTTPMQRSSNII
jgi:hypothetical protein